MNNYKNARLTVHGRALLVSRVFEDGLRPSEVAQAMGVSLRTVYKWLARYRSEGSEGLQNRSSRPRYCPHETRLDQQQQIIEQRRERRVYRHISAQVGVSVATIGRVLRRAGLNRLSALEPAPIGMSMKSLVICCIWISRNSHASDVQVTA